jgi:hypothetical protein
MEVQGAWVDGPSQGCAHFRRPRLDGGQPRHAPATGLGPRSGLSPNADRRGHQRGAQLPRGQVVVGRDLPRLGPGEPGDRREAGGAPGGDGCRGVASVRPGRPGAEHRGRPPAGGTHDPRGPGCATRWPGPVAAPRD